MLVVAFFLRNLTTYMASYYMASVRVNSIKDMRAAVYNKILVLPLSFYSRQKKGDIMALEVNMRPCGGFTPDMINFAHSTDVYKIWADMIAFDRSTMPVGEHAFCAFAGRRDGKNFVMNHDDIMAKYGHQMKMVERIPDVLSGAMGNQMYVATFPTREEMDAFYDDILRVW